MSAAAIETQPPASVGPSAPDGAAPAAAPHVAPNVAAAVQDVVTAFGPGRARAWADGSGGAQVVVDDVALSPAWACGTTWVGFAISHLVPEADTYPHYVRADLAYADGRGLTVPFSAASFAGMPAVQVSRRQRPGTTSPSAADKTRGVLAWLRSLT